jgi:polysaccharide chain length determinant protein (PEP-CTERM system associated)
MDEIIRQVLGILRGMWKFRWPAIIVAWLVAGFSAWQTFRLPDQYEATARVYVDTDSILKPLMTGLTVQPNVEQQLAMLTRTLLSRPNLERLVRMADLDLNVKTQEQRDGLIDSLAGSIRILNSGRDNLYTLAYRSENQDKAKRVIQSFVSMFVESSLGSSRKDSDSAKNFLSEQIRIYEARLEEAEANLKAFRLRNLELQSTEGGDAAGRVRAAQVALQQAQLELREAENARNAAKAQLDAERNQSQSAGTLLSRSLTQESSINIATPEIDARLEAQRRTLDTLIQRFTDQHPDVIITRRSIKELEEQKAAQMAALRQAAMSMPQPGGQGAGSPVMQEMQRILASTEVQVAQLKARVSEFSGRLAAAREGLKTAPELEAELAQLNRDYGIVRSTYDELVARRQKAIMSGELDSAAGVAEFRLIDPPRVSPKPVAPNRLAMLPGALFLGIGAGLGLAFLLSQLRPVFHDANELRAKTGVPLLGVVSMRLDEAQSKRERRGLVGFASAVGGLLGAFGIGLAVVAAMS